MSDPVFYRAQADQARADAGAAALDNVRDRFLRAAAAFEAMAERYERVANSRAAREAAVHHHQGIPIEHPDDSSSLPPAAAAAPVAAG